MTATFIVSCDHEGCERKVEGPVLNCYYPGAEIIVDSVAEVDAEGWTFTHIPGEDAVDLCPDHAKEGSE